MRNTQTKFTELLTRRLQNPASNEGERGIVLELIEDRHFTNTGNWRAEDPESFIQATPGRWIRFDFQSDGFALYGHETSGSVVWERAARLAMANYSAIVGEALDTAETFLRGGTVSRRRERISA